MNDLEIIKSIVEVEDIEADYIKSNNYYKWYYSLAQELQPHKIAEIGMRFGYSLFAMIRGCDNAPSVFGWDNQSYREGSVGITWHKLHPYVDDLNLFHVDTQYCNDLGVRDVDIFHVDGDHTYKGTMHDMYLAWKSLKGNGVLLLDDVDYCIDVSKAGADFAEEKSLELKYVKSFRGMYIIKKI
jgi:hypothetical protein